jgi:Uma2 family endonuclease
MTVTQVVRLPDHLLAPPGGWTEEALDVLPEAIHYEIEDGRLIVSPRPTFWHQQASIQMVLALRDACPPEWWPVQEGEIRVMDGRVVRQLRAPDTLVVPRRLTRRGAERGWAHPHEVALAAEVVSPGSTTSDRTTKVAVYAGWRIPLYLRLETEPEVVLAVYRLDPASGIYASPVEHRDVFVTEEPFPLRIDVGTWR